jgi:hypothetical protein
MGTVSYTPISDGTAAKAADVNTPLAAFATAVNGNLDANNLASNAVTTAKLTDGSVTPAKLQSGTGSTWDPVSFTPAWTNLTVGNGTNVGYWGQIGKQAHIVGTFTLGSTSAVGTAPTLTLPFTATANGLTAGISQIGMTAILDAGTTQMVGPVIYGSTTTAIMTVLGVGGTFGGPTTITSLVPMTWTTGDKLCYDFWLWVA